MSDKNVAKRSPEFTAIIVFETPVVLINLIMDSGVCYQFQMKIEWVKPISSGCIFIRH